MQSFLLRSRIPLILTLLMSFLYIHYFENRAYVDLTIQVQKKTWFTIFWADEEQGYSKFRKVRVRVNPKEKQYRLFLADLSDVSKLRIDPVEYVGNAVLRQLRITQNGYHAIQLKTESDFSQLKPIHHINGHWYGDNGLQVQSDGNDSQMELLVALKKDESKLGHGTIRIAILFIIIFSFFYYSYDFRDEKKFVPLLFIVAFILIFVMAALSVNKMHPDEYVHSGAAKYYVDNWLPPEVDSPDIKDTYSVYGVSRLNSPEISYFFTGKFSWLISALKLPEYLNFRLFNVMLFGLLCLYILRNPDALLLGLPLLISPQIWYIFGYCNSDAFALFVAFLSVCQVVLPGSSLNKYLNGDSGKKVIVVLTLSILYGALFLLKKNYYFLIIFLGGYWAWRLWYQMEKEKRVLITKRFLIIIILGFCVAGSRISLDYAVNGMDRSEKISQMQEERAIYRYKPSTPLEKTQLSLYRKARGDSLLDIINRDRFFEKTFLTSFGMYGYFTAAGTDSYYNSVRWVSILSLFFLVYFISRQGGWSGNMLLLLFFGCSSALIGASLYNSWTNDFQAQGRYLFPIVPMLGTVIFHYRHAIPNILLRFPLFIMFAFSVYSFIFVGLLKLPKIL